MMKKTVALTALALAINANAQNYASISTEMSAPHAVSESSYKKPGGGITAHLGTAQDSFRLEVAATYAMSNSKNADAPGQRAYSIMSNAYYDFLPQKDGTLVPYIGGGVGFIKFGDASLKNNEAAHTYQVIAGLSYRYDDSTDLFIDYRHVSTFKKLDNNNHYQRPSVNIGVVKYL